MTDPVLFRICSDCSNELPLSEFPSNGKKKRSQCRACRQARDGARKRLRYRTDHAYRERENQRRMQRLAANRPHTRALSRKHYRVASDTLSDSYVRGLIAKSMGISRSEVTQKVIDLARLTIQLKRCIDRKKQQISN